MKKCRVCKINDVDVPLLYLVNTMTHTEEELWICDDCIIGIYDYVCILKEEDYVV